MRLPVMYCREMTIQRIRLVLCVGGALLLTSAGAGAVRAQGPTTPSSPPQASSPPSSQAAPAAGETEPEETGVAPDSPRASLQAYLDAARAGEWDKAARYLSLSDEQKSEGPRLAERLKAVLDRYLWFDLETISPDSEGRRDDGLPSNLEEVGKIPIGGDRTQPVRLVRTSDAAGAYWAFSRATVGRIDAWYSHLEDRWIRDRLTRWGLGVLLLPGPRDILWWQWITLPLLVVLAWILGRVLGLVTRTVLGRLFARTKTHWDDQLLARIGQPLTFAWGLLVFYVALPSLGLVAPAERLLTSLVAAGAVVALFWALWRSVDVIVELLLSLPWAAESPSARNLLEIGANVGKGIIAGAGTVATLSAFGYPVATLLAGLGIGGLAVAFGAQKTVENLFGSISLAAAQPFRVGDFVKVEDFVGNVESIGLRSTRFRTLDRTLISIPNGHVADMRLESFSARDRMRLATTIGVEYGTTHAQMTEVLDGFERVLREHPKIWPDAVVVKFKEFGASSLDIEIMAWFQVPTWGDFQLCRQEVLLGFMKVVEDAGTGFAFPTRTVHLINEPSPTPPVPRGGAGGQASPRPAAGNAARPQDLPTADE
jgi:MscS family membrane protein